MRDIRKGIAHLLWRLSWWRRKRQVHSKVEVAERENVRRGAAVNTKMCRECRALIPSGADKCPECGAMTAHIRSGGFERRVAAAVPFKMNVSMMLISAYFIMFILGVILTLTLEPRGAGPGPTPLGALMNQDSRALVMTGSLAGHRLRGEIIGSRVSVDGRYFRVDGEGLKELPSGPEPWRLLTAIFLHGGIIHLAFNTMAMVWFGQLIENIYGSRRMFILFIVTGVLGNVVSLWWHGLFFLQVGASGAIFGMVGVAAVYAFTHKDALAEALRGNIVRVVMWAVMLSFIPGIDNAAHFGGMAAGAGMAWIMPDPTRISGVGAERLWRFMAMALAVFCAGALAFTFVRWAILS